MKVISILMIMLIMFNTYTYARYNFKKGSRKAGVGVIIFIVLSSGFALYVMLK